MSDNYYILINGKRLSMPLDKSKWPPAALNREATRQVAIYERDTDRLVAIFPNLP